MNINRHNYETYFLLYIDNELTAADRQAVEAFVHANPDVKLELEAIRQTVLPNKPVAFGAKEGLLKMESSVSEEQMMLLLDGELNAADAAKVRDAISMDPMLTATWHSLTAVKLDPETIVFPGKPSLYKTGEPARIVPFWWRRVAVAASILAVLLLAGIQSGIFDRNGKKESGLATQPGIESPGDNKPDNKSLTSTVEVTLQGDDKKEPLTPQQLTETVSTVNNAGISNQQPGNKNFSGNKTKKDYSEPLPVANNKNSLLENINKKSSNKINPPTVIPENNVEVPDKLNPNEVAQNKLPEEVSTPLSMPDVELKPLPANEIGNIASFAVAKEESTDKILFIDQEKVDRSKAGGFFRKLKRTIERKANIKGGKSLRIAGFEIAAK